MHYFDDAFSINGQATIEVRQRGRPCGNADGLGRTDALSDGDIAAATEMYGNLTPTVAARNADCRLEVFMVGQDKQL